MKRKITFLIAALAAIMLITHPIKVNGQEKTDPSVTLTISSYASTNSWSNGTQYKSASVSPVTFTAGGKSGFSNTGKYYSEGNTWRYYQTDEATITISITGAYEFKSVKFTYSVSNTGVLKDGSTTVSSGSDYSISGTSKTFSVGNSGAATNGQVRFTKIEVTYVSSGSPNIVISGDGISENARNLACTASGSLTAGVAYNNMTGYTGAALHLYNDSDCEEEFDKDWFSATLSPNTTITYSAAANTGVAREVYMRVQADYTSASKTTYYSNVIHVTQAAPTFSVTYDKNDENASGTMTDSNSPYAYGTTVTTLANSFTAPSGKAFLCWNTAPDYSGNDILAGGKFVITDDITLYAKWADICHVTYDENSSNSGSVPTDANNYASGSEVTVLGNTGTLRKTGFIWNGWNTEIDGTGTHYNSGDKFVITGDITLYAEWREPYKYTLVSDAGDIVTGKHYILVGAYTSAKDINATTYYAMGYQDSGNRKSVAVSKGGDNKITEVEGVYEIVINGSDTYIMYSEGYLYASSSSSNQLKTRYSNNDNDSKWSIVISDDEATITAQGDNTRKRMRFNYNGGTPLFSCYATDSPTGVLPMLYERDDDSGLAIYIPTTINSSTSISDLTISSTTGNALTIAKGTTLTVTGTITNTTAANLIIEDGGQLIASNSVAATVKKTIANAGAKDASEHWYTIASPVNDGTNNYIGINNTNTVNLTADSYDMFAYDEKAGMWLNQKEGSEANGFDKMYKGQGYLYRNSGNELSFVGNTNSGEVTYTLKNENTGDLAGFNLIGNPYPHDITMKYLTYSGTPLTGCYVITNAGGWGTQLETTATIHAKEGFLVQTVDNDNVVTFHETEQTAAKSNGDNIKFMVANSQYEDVAYALFDKGFGLSKINHRNADIPMLYINQEDTDYAIATMSDDTKSFNLNFKAMTTGKYTLSYKADGNFSYLHVIDRLTGEDVDMLLEGEYSFIAIPIDSENRFIVRLEYSAGSEISESSIFAYQSGNDIIVNGEGELQIFDMMGRRVLTQYVSGVETINLQLNGVYIFRLNEKTQKIVVK